VHASLHWDVGHSGTYKYPVQCPWEAELTEQLPSRATTLLAFHSLPRWIILLRRASSNRNMSLTLSWSKTLAAGIDCSDDSCSDIVVQSTIWLLASGRGCSRRPCIVVWHQVGCSRPPCIVACHRVGASCDEILFKRATRSYENRTEGKDFHPYSLGGIVQRYNLDVLFGPFCSARLDWCNELKGLIGENMRRWWEGLCAKIESIIGHQSKEWEHVCMLANKSRLRHSRRPQSITSVVHSDSGMLA
jgi:hypothetical protein